MAVSVGTITSKLILDSSAFSSGLKSSSSSLDKFGKDARREFASFEKAAHKAFSGLGRAAKIGIASATAALAGFGYAALKVAGDFESGMKGVQAVTGLAGDELGKLRDAALQMGRDTKYSAREASGALETLARNGLKGADTLIAASDAALQLAAATGTDIAMAADIATDAMAQFGFQAEEMTGVINQITQTTKESKFGIQDYFGALGAGGGAAGALGVEFDDFNATLAVTSNLFRSGRDAGTSLKTFITSLPGASGPAAQAIEDLGLKFYDAQGGLKDMGAIAGELEKAFGSLTEKEKAQAAQTIFGSDAMKVALGLAKVGESQFRDTASAIATEGDASEDAAIRMQGFSGAMTELGSKASDALIALGDAGLLGIAEDLARWAGENVSKFAAWVRESDELKEGFAAVSKFIDDEFKPAFDRVFNFVSGLIEDDSKGWEEKFKELMAQVGAVGADAFATAVGLGVEKAIPAALAGASAAVGGIWDKFLEDMSKVEFEFFTGTRGGSGSAPKGFANGGVFDAPESGELFIGHGREAVVPLGDGKPFARLAEILGVPGFKHGGIKDGASGSSSLWDYFLPDDRSTEPSAIAQFSRDRSMGKEYMNVNDLSSELTNMHLDIAQQMMTGLQRAKLTGGNVSGISMDADGRLVVSALTDIRDMFGRQLQAGIGVNQNSGSITSQSGKSNAWGDDENLNNFRESLRAALPSVDRQIAAMSWLSSESGETGDAFSKMAAEASAAAAAEAEKTQAMAEAAEAYRIENLSVREAAQERSDAFRQFVDDAEFSRQRGIFAQQGIQSSRQRNADLGITSTGATVDIQSAFSLLAGLGTGSNGTGKGVIRDEGPSGFSGQIADLIAKANKGAFLDVKQAGLDMFKGVLSDNLIRSVVDQAVTKANRSGAGTGSGMDFFKSNQRMIQEVVTELGRLALGSDGLRKAQMDLQLSAHTGATQLDIFKERMGLLAGGVEVSANAMKAEAEARVNSTETMGRNTLSQNDRLMEMAAASDRAKESLSGFAMGAAAAQGVSMAGGGAKHQLMIGGMASNGPTVTINVGGSVVTERQLANVILTHVQRDSRGSIGTGTI